MENASLLHTWDKHPLDDPLCFTEVAPTSLVEVAGEPGKTHHRLIRVNPSMIAPSSIPALRRQRFSLGLYSFESKKGDYVAMFMGPLIDRERGEKLYRAGYGTHVQTVGKDEDAYVINAAVDCADSPLPPTERVRWTLADYVERGAVGNMVNDYHGSREGKANCRPVLVRCAGVSMPLARTGELVTVKKVLLLQAKRDLNFGEELLVNYGKMARRVYIESEHFMRRMILKQPYPVEDPPLEFMKD